MKHRNPHIQEELKEISPAVANLPVNTPFDLPAHYFERFPERMMAQIREGMSPSEELEQLSPLLAGINKQLPFEVPEGYFQSLELADAGKAAVVLPLQGPKELVHAMPAEQASGKIISMNRWTSALRWAAAAVVTGLVFGALYFSAWRGETAHPDAGAMARVNTNQQTDTLPFSEETLAGFLGGTGDDLPEENLNLLESLPGESLANADFSDKKFQEILGEIPDEELEAFFQEMSESSALNSMN